MPQDQAVKKKKKGHAPVHQNKFAFHHNPKSKKTAAILASPIQHVCRRCHEKIEWKKQYRKYKPLTAPAKCNHCGNRNVKAAYHTICESCTRSSPQSLALLEQWNNRQPAADDDDDTAVTASARTYYRACAMCVKEPAIRSLADQEEDTPEPTGRKLKLREVKTLERQEERALAAKRKKKKKNDNDEDDDLDESDEDMSDAEDPFLQAVGGAEKLLTGDAYQNMLLQREQGNIQTDASTDMDT
ncbi:hypothetical protein FisN_2Hh236 [Fistulifera solaris]|jgi:hypothetical protein|uniref:Uncharacterized protein n=1 Tax=Fistulifera solaris TaxID=1519565 RepID=A0A1Z5JEH6_FISSO|nr:hypothetical protein FisN_2Hh236 [Fistulifera solaris]|eukprot:GAX12405.1 hypothetical protein FisN_2Hh236 [Fistulifera solaris]